MVQSARPLATSRSSLPSSGRIGARWTRAVSGERKEDILQVGCGCPCLRAQLRERADAGGETERVNRLCKEGLRSAVDCRKQFGYPRDILVLPRTNSVGQVEEELAPAR